MINKNTLNKLRSALTEMLEVLERFHSVLLDRSEAATFSELDTKDFMALYYSCAAPFSASWETARCCAVKLCHDLSDADASADQSTLQCLDEWFCLFLNLEKAIQDFTAETEAVFHQDLHFVPIAPTLHRTQLLSLSIRAFKEKIEA